MSSAQGPERGLSSGTSDVSSLGASSVLGTTSVLWAPSSFGEFSALEASFTSDLQLNKIYHILIHYWNSSIAY
jgi:hypothetical protein